MAVCGLISHLTAGLASGNRKYDITDIQECGNVRLPVNTAGTKQRARRMDTTDNSLQRSYSNPKD